MSQPSLQQLQSEITAANAAIASETKNRTTADTNEVSARQQADANEANRAQLVEAGLASRIAGLESSVSTLQTTIAALQSTATTLVQQMIGALAAITALQAQPAPAPVPDPVPAPVPDPAPAPDPAPGGAVADLTITLNLAEGALTFDEGSATYETWIDELLNQSYMITTMAQYPWTVRTFRAAWTDAVDVAVAYGGLYTDNPATSYSKPYAITAGGKTLNVPFHRWGATVCLTIGEWPVMVTRDQLVAKRLVPEFDRSISLGDPGILPPPPLMGFSGLSPDEEGTGGRPEIGLLHENESYYLVTGNSFQSVTAIADSMGSFPTHITDVGGVPMDLRKYPDANFYGNYSTPPVALGDSADVSIDQAHVTHGGYLAYLSTRRPYLLRRAQDMATFCQARQAGNHQVICADAGNQVRGDAWVLLWALYCYLGSPPAAACPSYLLPREYWLAQLQRHGAWFDKYMMTPCDNVIAWNTDGYGHWGSNAKNAALHSATSVLETSFKEFYFETVLGLIADTSKLWPDLADWVARFAWKVQFSIDRSSGLTAWDQRFGAFYYIATYKLNGVPVQDVNLISANRGTVTPIITLADLFESNKQLFDLTAPAGKPWVDPQVGPEYLMFIRAAFIYAKRCALPNPGLPEAYAFVVPQVPATEYRLAIAP